MSCHARLLKGSLCSLSWPGTQIRLLVWILKQELSSSSGLHSSVVSVSGLGPVSVTVLIFVFALVGVVLE